MLLEMFGYLSGDERLHEIAEVYHWEMVQVSHRITFLEYTRHQLITSLQIIEMYNLWPSTGSGLEEDRRRYVHCTNT